MEKVKYQRTKHVPWSNPSSDDEMTTPLYIQGYFCDKEIVITEKMDGENTTLYSNAIHARSLDSRDHESRHWIKGLWASIKANIPNDIRICGENMYALHTIPYENLESYFLVFNIFDKEKCLSWDDTLKICSELGLSTVPTIYRGPFNLKILTELSNTISPQKEGYVFRPANSFLLTEANSCIFKYVRPNHVQETEEHWFSKPVVKNKLKENNVNI